MCVNDWSLEPCSNHGSCADCGEHLVEKGNRDHKRRATELLEDHEWLLERAEAEAREDTCGASNFVQHNRRMVDGLTKIIAVHDDPEIPDGMLVHVNADMPSRYGTEPLDGQGSHGEPAA